MSPTNVETHRAQGSRVYQYSKLRAIYYMTQLAILTKSIKESKYSKVKVRLICQYPYWILAKDDIRSGRLFTDHSKLDIGSSMLLRRSWTFGTSVALFFQDPAFSLYLQHVEGRHLSLCGSFSTRVDGQHVRPWARTMWELLQQVESRAGARNTMY